MCGIFVTNDLSLKDRLSATLRTRLAFRGPDSQSGVVEHQGWLLYHSRLSIIAPEDVFSQPLFTREGGVLIFNGEILNFDSLAESNCLQNRGSDTDILAQLLELPEFDLNQLEGFFAFVHIDPYGRMTHCVRDRFGVKPLVYYRKGDRLAICSEGSVLSDLYGLGYNPQALGEYHAFRAPIFAGTYFEGMCDVEPGTCLVNGKYFDTLDHVAQKYARLSDISDDLEKTLEGSIKSRLIADVPVGLLLSGGIDSNLIRAYSNSHFQCLTGGFDGDYDVEISRVIGGRDVQIVTVGPEAFRQRLAEMVRLRKEPLSVPNEVVLSFLAEAWQKRGGRVLLSGEAADEFFGGYDRIFHWAAYAEDFSLDHFLQLYAYIDSSQIDAETRSQFDIFFRSLPKLTPFETVRQFFLKKHLPILFRRLDFALMYSGVEGREPFASTAMFELAMIIQPKDLFRQGLGKVPLRELAARKLGVSFAYAPKVGFPIDLGLIFRNSGATDRRENYELWFRENMRLIS
jgi:asparagine synthase (glutamine-hydrolysing)